MRICKHVLPAVVMLLGSVSAASAQSIYYGAHGGLNLAHDSDFGPSGSTLELSFDPGFAIGGFVGYEFGGGLRAEGELSYRANDGDSFLGVGLDGDVTSLAFMVNGFYDFDIGSPFTPYVGGGVGVASVSLNDVGAVGIVLADDDDVVFAYQLGFGVGYELSPTLTLTADYRYFATADGEFTTGPLLGGIVVDGEYSNSTFLVGARATF